MSKLVILRSAEIIIQQLKSLRTVVIVGVDDRKRTVNNGTTAERRMTGTPWFGSALRHSLLGWNIRHGLIAILHFCKRTDFGADQTLKISLIFFFDNKNNFFETCTQGIINRKVNDQFTIVADGCDLLQTTKAAAHAGCQNDQRWFVHKLLLSSHKNIYCNGRICRLTALVYHSSTVPASKLFLIKNSRSCLLRLFNPRTFCFCLFYCPSRLFRELLFPRISPG